MWGTFHPTGYPKRIATAFVGVALVSACIAALFLIDSFRSYSADTELLISPKSVQGAVETQAVRDSLRIIGSRRDFFLEASDEADMTGIAFEEIGSGAVRVIVTGENPIDARDAAIVVTRELFARIGKYYDIRDDIVVRSLGSPEVRTVIAHPLLWIVSSLLSGIAISIFFFICVLFLARLGFSLQRKGSSEHVRQATSLPERFRKAESEVPASASEAFVPKKVEQSFFSFEPSGMPPQADYAHFHRGPAPENLPIASDDAEPLPDFLAGMIDAKVSPSEEEPAENIVPTVPAAPTEIEPVVADTPPEIAASDREPTAEEYKRRLNELLSGKMPTEKR
jgi:hypothetical protein